MRNQFERALGQVALPGGILCQGDAPEGCGNGIKSKRCSARVTRNFRPITFLQFCAIDELDDRQSADGNNETRPQNSNFIIHPPAQLRISSGDWDAVGAAGIFTRETAADGGEIDL